MRESRAVLDDVARRSFVNLNLGRAECRRPVGATRATPGDFDERCATLIGGGVNGRLVYCASDGTCGKPGAMCSTDVDIRAAGLKCRMNGITSGDAPRRRQRQQSTEVQAARGLACSNFTTHQERTTTARPRWTSGCRATSYSPKIPQSASITTAPTLRKLQWGPLSCSIVAT